MNQEAALKLIKAGNNVFLTGSAGAGKTYVLNEYIQYLKDRDVPVAVTASTGIAATHMNGMTIHAWSGIGIKNALAPRDLKFMATKKYLKDQLESAKVLIIDEISMLHRNQLDMVNQVLQYFKDNQLPFGGIQVIFSGDFFQLPPVSRSAQTNAEKFAFMSQAWLDADLNICYLTDQYRQSNNELNQILNEIRADNVTPWAVEALSETQNNEMEEGWQATKLFTHNYDVDRINIAFLNELDEQSHPFTAKIKGNQKLQETLKKSVLVGEEIELKIGAEVMFVKNNYEKGYMNGTLGKIVGFDDDDGYPEVELLDGRKMTVEEEVWSIENDNGKVLASFSQIPLRLAWAITVHKSQGMTLEAAEIDLSKTFERGQGYVALSRLKDLKGLKLSGLNEVALQVDSLAKRADQRFRELSEQAESIIDENEMKSRAITFIKSCGGITDPDEIERLKKKRADKKRKKGKRATYFVTREFMEDGLSLEDIANIRGMAEGTIKGHVLKIRELYPEFDLSAYRPPDSVLKRVQQLHNDLTKKDQLSLKALYDGLNRSIDYADIKLALAFIKQPAST